jgi:hypothetical protein
MSIYTRVILIAAGQNDCSVASKLDLGCFDVVKLLGNSKVLIELRVIDARKLARSPLLDSKNVVYSINNGSVRLLKLTLRIRSDLTCPTIGSLNSGINIHFCTINILLIYGDSTSN